MVDLNNNLSGLMKAKPSSISQAKSKLSSSSAASTSSSSNFSEILSENRSRSAEKSNAQEGSNLQEKSNSSERSPRVEAKSLPNPPGRSVSQGIDQRLESRRAEPVNTMSRPERVKPSVAERVNEKELDESVDDLAHRQALQKFLQKMKQEFGVDAEAILTAFASLNSQELAQPAEASLDKLVQALQLSPEQAAQAKTMFQSLLKETSANGLSDYLKSSNRKLSLEVISQGEARERKMQAAIDQMQSNFFGPAKVSKKSQAAAQEAMAKYQKSQSDSSSGLELSAEENAILLAAMGLGGGLATEAGSAGISSTTSATSATSSSGAIDPQSFGLDFIDQNGQDLSVAMPEGMASVESGDQKATAADLFQTRPQKNPEAAPPLNQVQIDAATDGTQMPYEVSSAEAGSTKNEFFMSQLKAPQIESAAAASMPAPAPAAAPSAPSVPAISAGIGLNMTAQMGDGSDDVSDQTPDDSTSWQQLTGQGLERSAESGKVQRAEGFMINTQPTAAQEARNLREVVGQAQMMAQKGGGEMKITMTPEGLGQVNMKVNVKGDQVTVEMVAESTEAKRMIEKGLGELKSSLASHNLKVDLIRVETPSDISNQLNKHNDDAQRQFAQQFMEQFRQDNNEWRRGFFDIPGAKAYRSQRDQAESGNVNVPESARRRESARRLDLVA